MQLVRLKMLILISINILDMELDLIDMGFFLILIIFGADMNSSKKIDNGKKDTLILGKGPIQRLEHTLSSAKLYSINFTENDKNICQSLHYNGANIYLLMVEKFMNLKQKILKL